MKSDKEKFLKRLKESRPAQFLVGYWLYARGNEIRINPGVDRPDTGDIFFRKPMPEAYGAERIWTRAEVKHRSLDFVCLGDYPFPDVMVCNCKSWDRSIQKPSWYFILNKEMTHALAIPGRTFDSWEKRDRPDSYYGRSEKCYFCPLELCRVEKLDF